MIREPDAGRASGTGRGSPLLWLALLVIGQAATLVLMQSGKEVTYPHLQFGRMTRFPTMIASVMIVLQAGLVLWGIASAADAIRRWVSETFSRIGLVAALGVLGLFSAVASRDPRVFAAELLLASALQGLALGTAVLFARSLDDRATTRLTSWLAPRGDDRSQGGPGRFLDPFAVASALAVTVGCALLAAIVYERLPHVPDEIVYLLQARYFAAGMMELPAPPVAAAFDVDLLHYEPGRVFSPLPPGWPAILAIGVKLGAPWIVNPLLSGLCVLLLHALMRRLETPRTARLATFLLATSPWFLFLGMSLMTHTATLACALGASLGIAVARERSAAWPAAAAGLGIGLIALIRPLEGLAVAVALGLWSLTARHRWFRLLPSAVLTGVTMLVTSVHFPYNAALSGSWRQFPIMSYVDKYYAPGANDMGFGANRGMGWGGLDPWPGHGLRDVLLNTLLNGAALNLEMFAWATGSVLLLAGLLATGRLRRLDAAMLGIILLVLGLHAFYWFGGGPDFAARYWFLILIPCIALTARAPTALLGAGTPAESRGTAMLLALSASAMLTWMPWRSVEKYHGFRYMTPAMRDFVSTTPLDNALVLVRGRRHPDYHLAALENPLDLADTSRTIFAWDRTSDIRKATIAAFPGRVVYVVDGPTITGGGFRVVAGPLPPGSPAFDLPSSGDIPSVVNVTGSDGVQRRTP
jgi:hypothetical protein